jgi:membrane-associated phospholipid phosphatase
MSDLWSHPEEVATTLGASPVVLLAGLIAAAFVGAVAIVAAARFAFDHAPRFLRRVTALEYLAVHLVLGFAVVIGLSVFAALATRIGRASTATSVDLALAQSLHAATSPGITEALRGVTFLGEGWIQATIGVLVALALVRGRRKLWAMGWVVALVGAGLLNTVLKQVFARPRPVLADPILVASGFSFPSGHSMGTFVLAGMAAYLAVLHTRGTARHVGIVAIALSWSVTMGFSRMYLGVHYLSDVIAGFAAGACWLAVCISGVEVVRRRSVRSASPG